MDEIDRQADKILAYERHKTNRFLIILCGFVVVLVCVILGVKYYKENNDKKQYKIDLEDIQENSNKNMRELYGHITKEFDEKINRVKYPYTTV